MVVNSIDHVLHEFEQTNIPGPLDALFRPCLNSDIFQHISLDSERITDLALLPLLRVKVVRLRHPDPQCQQHLGLGISGWGEHTPGDFPGVDLATGGGCSREDDIVNAGANHAPGQIPRFFQVLGDRAAG